MHYLITGHTGFKGAWLTLLLASRGHMVSGFALDPSKGALFDLAGLSSALVHEARADVRNTAVLREFVERVEPDVVIHLAAQPLVRESYLNPRETFEINAMGTLSLLEATQSQPSIRARLIVTTDKVYRNTNQIAGYVEKSPLGGSDPYSASKAMADLLTQSWVASYPNSPTAIARAGNVIGGGDVSVDRLLPDLIQAFTHGKPAYIRYPSAVRPWQHVLDCLNGYLSLTAWMMDTGGAGEWNFGPGPESFISVGQVADLTASFFGSHSEWITDGSGHPHEASLLALDATKANKELGWMSKLSFVESVRWTVEWHRALAAGVPARDASLQQIQVFESLAGQRTDGERAHG